MCVCVCVCVCHLQEVVQLLQQLRVSLDVFLDRARARRQPMQVGVQRFQGDPANKQRLCFVNKLLITHKHF